MKKINNTYTHNIFKIFLTFVIVFSLSFWSIPYKAFADISGNDKLYGQTLSDRKMSVADCPNISAKYAALMDSKGNLIYERASTESGKIASMTKIMTALVCLDNASLQETLTISQNAADVGESSAGLWQGDTITVEAALKALMVPSGNDAAVAIEEFIGKKVVDNKDSRLIKSYNEEGEPQEYITDVAEAFATLMNNKAQNLNCENSYFTNPHGLDDGKWASDAHSCAKDMVKITKYAMENQTFRAIVSGGDCVITVTRNSAPVSVKLASTDILLGSYAGCIGVKTGVTDLAGACFSGAAHDDTGNEIYTIVMHSNDESTRFVDTQVLFDWYFENINNYCPAKSTQDKITVYEKNISNGELVNSTEENSNQNEKGSGTELGVVAHVSHQDWANTTFCVTTKKQDTTSPVLKFAGNVYLSIDDSNIKGDYKTGDYVCDLIMSQHNIEVGRIPLYAAQDQPKPNFFQNIGVWFDKTFRGFFGNPQTAPTTISSTTDSIQSKD